MARPSVYLDHAATAPVRPEVREAMEPFLAGELFGNPSSTHRFGRQARAAVEEARQRIAAALGTEPETIVFTSGGTEADNLAVAGAALAARRAGRPCRVAVSAIEHKAVLGAAHWVEALGGECLRLPVDGDGRLALDALEEALARGLALVSVMWVNNEVGVVQDVQAIADRCAAAGVPFHSDAVQAVGKIPCPWPAGCTLLSLSGHKLGAPQGIGALVVRDRRPLHPIIQGGGQQFGLRAGTENVPGIVGLGRAVELAVAEVEGFGARVGALRDEFERRVLAALPGAQVAAAGARRAPHISNLSIPGAQSETLLLHLDLAGIACSSGSACSSGAVEPSHVLQAMGVPLERALGSLRFSFGRDSTAAEVDYAVSQLPAIAAKARQLGGALAR